MVWHIPGEEYFPDTHSTPLWFFPLEAFSILEGGAEWVWPHQLWSILTIPRDGFLSVFHCESRSLECLPVLENHFNTELYCVRTYPLTAFKLG